jgi:hypothetical protein
MDILENLPPAVVLVLALLLVVWLALLLLVPFMIESIRGSVRRSSLELAELNKKMDRVIELLAERNELPPFHGYETHDVRPSAAERTRREPTISG